VTCIRRNVRSDAYPNALEILDRNRVVIISGAPGVGKTTLANMLLYVHLERGWEPVVIRRTLPKD
jgi:KaiC/GvpD/RAD55 family RecA-like ATPase